MLEVFNDTKLRHTPLPKNSNLINYSILNEFYSPAPFRSFSIKYVVEGTELYSVNGNKYSVKNNEYLLANKFSEGYVEVDSKKAVKGICIDVEPKIISEVVASYLKPDAACSDLELDKFFNTPSFFENKYKAFNSYVGKILISLEKQLESNPSFDLNFNKEFYYQISEGILKDHIPIYKQLHAIKAVKYYTKKDLYKRLLRAKEYLDDSFLAAVKIEEVAALAAISEYHFYRLFKSAFQISPHQYLIKKRLQYALQVLHVERLSVSEVALASGFSDIHSFSKSFKKCFGFSPSKIAKTD